MLPFSLFGCRTSDVREKPFTKERGAFVTPDARIYVVLNAESVHYVFDDIKPATLSEEEIAQTELLLSRCIDELNVLQEKGFRKLSKNEPKIRTHKDEFVISLSNYKRQFIPVTNEKGEKVVWVNCFCDEKEYWRKSIVFVLDGGNCYFNVKINLTQRTYYNLRVNGNA